MDSSSRHAQIVAELLARGPEHAIGPSLERIQALVELLSDPHRSAPVIQITGTNGKGSTAIMIDALLRAQGLRTGRYSSPHLRDITERIAVDGEPVSEEVFDETWEQIRPFVEMVDAQQIDDISMTFFEVMTGLAFAIFADAPVDVMVLEVGMGGAWDATNVADAAVAVVTPIDVDHTQYLGSTPAEIAQEKAGIIKAGAHAVLAGQTPEVARVLLARCAEVGAVAVRDGLDFGLLGRTPAVGGQVLRLTGAGGPVDDVVVPLFGEHMAHNAALALAVVETFEGNRPLSAEVVQSGFADVIAEARTELVRSSPSVVLDTAHNPHAVAATLRTVDEAYGFSPMVVVLGMMTDKDAEGVAELVAEAAAMVVVTQPAGTRARPADELAEIVAGFTGPDRVLVAPRLDEAIDRAVALADAAGAGSGVLILGSVALAGEVSRLFGTGQKPRPTDDLEVTIADDDALDPEDGWLDIEADRLARRDWQED